MCIRDRVPLIHKIIQLRRDLLPSLSREQLLVLQHRRVEFIEPEPLGALSKVSKQPRPPPHLLRRKVPRPLGRSHVDRASRTPRRRVRRRIDRRRLASTPAALARSLGRRRRRPRRAMPASSRAQDSRPSLGVRARVPRHAPRRRRGRPARDASPRRRPHRPSVASRGGPDESSTSRRACVTLDPRRPRERTRTRAERVLCALYVRRWYRKNHRPVYTRGKGTWVYETIVYVPHDRE